MRVQSFLSVLVLPILIAAIGCDGGDPPNDNTGGSGNTGGGNTGGGSNGVGDLALDTSFGTDGIARASRPYSTDFVNAAAWMPDGGILYGGSTGDRIDFHPDMLLARFTASGALDTSFGNGGFVVTPMGDGAAITDIESLADGGAIVAGTFYRYNKAYAFVSRIDAKGSLDPSFGTGGSARVEIDLAERYARIARSESGQIALLVTEDSNDNVWLMRFDANGKLDTTFGDAGHTGLAGEAPRDIIAMPDGSYLALTMEYSKGWFYHINSDGTVDSSFGGSGGIEMPDEPFDIERHESGKVLVSGGGDKGWIMQFDSTGMVDTTFGTNGVIDPLLDDDVTSVKWLPNGEFLAIVSIVTEPPSFFFRSALRFDSNGAPVTWNSGFSSPLSKTLTSSGVTEVLQKEGKIYFVGSKRVDALNDSRDSMAFVVNDDASVDETYGTAGIAMAGSKAPPEVLWGMARSPNGSVIATGTAGTDGIFARFSDGKHDTTFGTDGFAPIATFYANAVAVDAQERMVIATAGLNVGRYLPTGERDMAFGMMGTASIMPTNGIVSDVMLDSKQRIVVCGETGTNGAFVARLLDDGTPDPAFGTNGVAEPAAGLAMAGAASCVVDSNDKIAFAAIGWGARETFFGRINEDGTTDTSFGTAGAPTLVEERIRAFRMIGRKSGGFLAVGSDWWCATDPACTAIVVALRADGTLDEGFGTGGLARIEDASYYQAWQGLVELPDGSVVVAGAIQEDTMEKLAVWYLHPDGTIDAKPFVLPGKGRATAAMIDNDGVLVGGWAFNQATGSDMVLLRFGF